MYGTSALEYEAHYRYEEHLARAAHHRLLRSAATPAARVARLRRLLGVAGAALVAVGVRLERAAGRYDPERAWQGEAPLRPNVSWG